MGSYTRAITWWCAVVGLVVNGTLAELCWAETTKVIVREFSSPPNYAATSDHNDALQLTDGGTAAFPMWTKRDAVGWAHATPVTLSIELGRERTQPMESRQGTLRIHTAKGLYAGVDVPRQIDVYSKGADGTYYKTGSGSPISKQLADKAHHWITVPVPFAGTGLLVVLHAGGEFLFVDEVVWDDSGKAGALPKERLVGSKTQALTDSTESLRANLMARALAPGPQSTPAPAGVNVVMWLQDPWSALPSDLATPQLNKIPKRVVAEGFQGEQESICVGLKTWASGAMTDVRLEVTGVPSEAVRLFYVAPVVAASGQLVYDPLVPLGTDRKLALRAEHLNYAWISLDLRLIPVGTHTVTIAALREGGAEATIISGEVIVHPPLPQTTQPAAVNWAYIRDTPIWRNPDVAFQDLQAHGINVFVLHPADIPGVGLDGMWSAEHWAGFNTMLRLVRGRGMLLLYLGWDITRNPLGLSKHHPDISSDAKRRLSQWLDRMSAYLDQHGFSKQQWALYPVDEPRGDNIVFLEAVARAIKSTDPQIRVYADPTSGKTGHTSLDDLRRLDEVIDIWQPNLEFVRGQAHTFFSGLQKPWWLYGNPTSPAKLGSPLQHYRLLAWWSWIFGARGVGFWSYSDTNGSSAWNDVDGKYPDWAVVYEGDNQVISSRRWEAFREGLEDYALLSALDRRTAEALLGASVGWNPSTLDLHAWTSDKVNSMRRDVFDRLH